VPYAYFKAKKMEKRNKRAEEEDAARDNPILDLALEYMANGAYPTGILKQRKGL